MYLDVTRLSDFYFAARARTKAKEGVTEGWWAKFPKDVIYCEQLTNGNPNILNEEPFAEKKKEKVDYSLIFGDPEEIQQKKEEIIQKSVIKKIRSREDRGGPVSSPKPITHPRFLGRSDHTVRILTQPSTPYHLARGDKAPSPSPSPSTARHRYTCPLCEFATARVNVMLMHSKSHSAPDRTNLANYARARPASDTKSEVRGSRLFAEAKASFTSKRKLVQSPRVNSEPSPKKSKVVKKPKVSKKEKEEREEKKNAIFGDWSEDENEEEEERVKLKESIESLFSNEEDSDEEFFQFKTNDQLEAESNRETANRSLRERKTPEKSRNVPGSKRKKKSKKKQSAADAVSSLIKSSLDSNSAGSTSEGEDNFDFYSDHADLSDGGSGSPPASPPPVTPSKKPVILKKSSTRSFQLPSRPDGKLELIKHESSETKYAGISAKAKAKQLARTQLNKDELFDKLIETEVSPQKETKLKIEDQIDKVSVESHDEKASHEVQPVEAEQEVSSEPPLKTIETYDFECDSEVKGEEQSVSPASSSQKPPSRSPVSPCLATVSKIVVQSPQHRDTDRERETKPEVKSPTRTPSLSKSPVKERETKPEVKSPMRSPSLSKSPVRESETKPEVKSPVGTPSPLIVSKTSVVGTTKLVSPNKIVTVHSNKVSASPTKIVVEKPRTSPVSLQKPVLATISKVTIDKTKTTPALLQKKTSPVIPKKPTVVDSEKPVVAGVTKIVGQPSKNIVLSKPKPAVATVNNSAGPLKLGTKIVTLSQKQDASINSLPSIALANQKKDSGAEKPLTISLESKRSTTIKPIVKTVDIPKRVSKLKEGPGGPSKPVVHLDKNEKTKAPKLEIKLETKPAVKVTEAVVVTETPKSSLTKAAVESPGINGTKTDVSVASAVSAGELQLVSEQGLPVMGDGDGEMIYLLVDDGTDPNLEHQTLYIDPSQLAAATGSVPVLLQTAAGGEQLVLQSDGLSNLVILEDKVEDGAALPGSTVVTSADTTGGVATLPSHPSSSLLSSVGRYEGPGLSSL